MLHLRLVLHLALLHLVVIKDPEVLSTVKGQFIEFTTTSYQDRVPVQNKFSAAESTIIQSEINKLLQKEVIKPATNEPGQFTCTIFLRPKPDGTHHMNLNLKQFNINIKDAYYSVPIAESDQKYLNFEWQGILYQFTCFPNGLPLCPRKFTKLLKPVYCCLRKKGHLSSGCIDNSYLQGDRYQDCLSNVVDTIKLFDSLGFIIHPKKSVFIPTQMISFLGFVLDSRTMTVYLTQHKQESKAPVSQLLNAEVNSGNHIKSGTHIKLCYKELWMPSRIAYMNSLASCARSF